MQQPAIGHDGAKRASHVARNTQRERLLHRRYPFSAIQHFERKIRVTRRLESVRETVRPVSAYHARIVSGLTIFATSASALRPRRLPISARVILCGEVRRKRPCNCSIRIRFSAARYSLHSSNASSTAPVMQANTFRQSIRSLRLLHNGEDFTARNRPRRCRSCFYSPKNAGNVCRQAKRRTIAPLKTVTISRGSRSRRRVFRRSLCY